MAVYVIGYDLHPSKGETYSNLIAAIQSVGDRWWHYLDSTWIVITSKTAAQIRDELGRHISTDDRLLVVQHKGATAWKGFDQAAANWLRAEMSPP